MSRKKEPFTLDFTNPTPGEGDFIQILTSHSPEKKIFDYKSLFLHILQNRLRERSQNHIFDGELNVKFSQN